MSMSRGVGKYQIVVGHIIKPILKSGGALYLWNHQKAMGHVPQGPTYSGAPDVNDGSEIVL